MFDLITPISYWILTILWLAILVLYLGNLRQLKITGGAVAVLLTILAIDAFRTVFESVYFGLYFNSLFGLLPKSIYEVLSQPELVIIPKLLNVVTGLIVLFLLIRRWLPREIREREEWIVALQESENRFRDFAEAAAEWFWEMDENLRFSYFSNRFTEISGVEEKDLLGKTRRESGLNIEDEKVIENIETIENHLPFSDFEHSRIKPDGSIVYMSTAGTPVFDEHGVFKGYRGTGTDITKRKLAEENLLKSKDEAEKANAAKSEFLAAMSHDLRTPLNAIMGFSDMMRQKAFGPLGDTRYEDYAADIHSSGALLVSLINDVLDLSKIEAGKYELAEEDISFEALINVCVRQLAPLIGISNLTLTMDIVPNLPHMIGDERALIQILNNLISNAIKFTPAGGVVSVSAALNEDTGIIVKIQDTGIGMSDEDIDKSTRPFEQAASNRSRKHEGTGLGLHLSATFMKLFGGNLQIDSKVDIGTTVTLNFPPERIISPS